jgi:hypothetical protein
MNLDAADRIARAVLYEGYMLYPYRPSSLKNRQRWNFGVLYPPEYCQSQTGADASFLQSECLMRPRSNCRIEIRVRFLHLVDRTFGRLKEHWSRDLASEPDFAPVATLEVAGKVLQPWQEVKEREVALTVNAEELPSGVTQAFAFSAAREFEPVPDETKQGDGLIVRSQQAVSGKIELSAGMVADGTLKLTVLVRNETLFDHADGKGKDRDHALRFSLLSTHIVLGIEDGEFISLLDPPSQVRDLPAQCRNLGVWPVLVGEAGQRDTVLCSPIILYDYPQVAPESAGDLFDGAEIDEILSLRIMTMTDEEKREMRESDPSARGILERTEALSPERLLRLHGVIRSLRPLHEEGS